MLHRVYTQTYRNGVHRREVTPMEKLECDRAGNLELPSSASQPPVCLKPGSHVFETRSLKKSRSCTLRETFLFEGPTFKLRNKTVFLRSFFFNIFYQCITFWIIFESKKKFRLSRSLRYVIN